MTKHEESQLIKAMDCFNEPLDGDGWHRGMMILQDLVIKHRQRLIGETTISGVGSTGLDDGPYLPGEAPRKKPSLLGQVSRKIPTPKTKEEKAEMRRKAWETRRRRRLETK